VFILKTWFKTWWYYSSINKRDECPRNQKTFASNFYLLLYYSCEVWLLENLKSNEKKV
jgi:hypothetical protein